MVHGVEVAQKAGCRKVGNAHAVTRKNVVGARIGLYAVLGGAYVIVTVGVIALYAHPVVFYTQAFGNNAVAAVYRVKGDVSASRLGGKFVAEGILPIEHRYGLAAEIERRRNVVKAVAVRVNGIGRGGCGGRGDSYRRRVGPRASAVRLTARGKRYDHHQRCNG